MKRFKIEWAEFHDVDCYGEIEAETKEEAFDKWVNGQFVNGTYESRVATQSVSGNVGADDFLDVNEEPVYN